MRAFEVRFRGRKQHDQTFWIYTNTLEKWFLTKSEELGHFE